MALDSAVICEVPWSNFVRGGIDGNRHYGGVELEQYPAEVLAARFSARFINAELSPRSCLFLQEASLQVSVLATWCEDSHISTKFLPGKPT